MNRIVLEAVPAECMRPPYRVNGEGGDWFYDPNGELVIRVAGDDLGKAETFLFALHELIEAMLCRRVGIVQEAVDRFDMRFEREREAGLRGTDDEPGDDPESPYRRQHRKAMLVEHLVADFLGISDYGTVA